MKYLTWYALMNAKLKLLLTRWCIYMCLGYIATLSVYTVKSYDQAVITPVIQSGRRRAKAAFNFGG